MKAVPTQISELFLRLGLDLPTPLSIRREAARELCAEILDNLADTSRAQEYSERAAFILHGETTNALPASLRATAHSLCQFVAAGLPT